VKTGFLNNGTITSRLMILEKAGMMMLKTTEVVTTEEN
jgi:hypothetical protein